MERTVHQVGFRSSAFPPDPTEAELGGGPHGMALAYWIEERLRSAGIEPGEPVPEDFGWLVDVHGPGRVVVSCGATDEGALDFVVTVEDVPRRLRRPDPEAPALVARVVEALDGALRADPAVADVAWEQGGPPVR
jgi:hypothetical protein